MVKPIFKNNKHKVFGTVLIILLVCSCFLLAGLWGPEGKYDFPELGIEGYSYYELKDGNMFLVTPIRRKQIGHYEKLEGKWILFEMDGANQVIIEPTLLNLHIKTIDNSEEPFSPHRRLWYSKFRSYFESD